VKELPGSEEPLEARERTPVAKPKSAGSVHGHVHFAVQRIQGTMLKQEPKQEPVPGPVLGPIDLTVDDDEGPEALSCLDLLIDLTAEDQDEDRRLSHAGASSSKSSSHLNARQMVQLCGDQQGSRDLMAAVAAFMPSCVPHTEFMEHHPNKPLRTHLLAQGR
jgi:hypothetical protein